MVELSGYVYRCSAGETFDMVALNIYDHEKYAADLMNANPGYFPSMKWLPPPSEPMERRAMPTSIASRQ